MDCEAQRPTPRGRRGAAAELFDERAFKAEAAFDALECGEPMWLMKRSGSVN